MGLFEIFTYRLTVHFPAAFFLDSTYFCFVQPNLITTFTFMPTFIIQSVVRMIVCQSVIII